VISTLVILLLFLQKVGLVREGGGREGGRGKRGGRRERGGRKRGGEGRREEGRGRRGGKDMLMRDIRGNKDRNNLG
jgi:hypothetical protein